MTKVTAQMSISLDGCYAGPKDDRDPKDIAGWMAGPEAPGFFRVTRWVVDAMAWRERLGIAGGDGSVNSDIIEEHFTAAGAYLMGRRMFDGGEGPWGDEPPFRAPVFVVTHRPQEPIRRGETTFHFVTDGLAHAIDAAKAAANGKDVAVAGWGTFLRHALVEGVVDELELHIVPVVLGGGQQLFGPDVGLSPFQGIELEPLRVVDTQEVTHVRYAVVGRSDLHLDDRGRDRETAPKTDGSL